MKEMPNLSEDEKKDFSEKFLTKFLENGFGSLSKREIEIFIFHLLYNESSFFVDKSNYEMANALMISESRVKSLKAEANLKYQHKSHKDALREIADIFLVYQKNHPDIIGDELQFSLEDPVLQREFAYAVKQLGYTTDTSFNREIVKVKGSVFFNIIVKNFDENEDKFTKIVKGEIPNQKEYQDIIDKNKPLDERIQKFMQKIQMPVSVLSNIISIYIKTQGLY